MVAGSALGLLGTVFAGAAGFSLTRSWIAGDGVRSRAAGALRLDGPARLMLRLQAGAGPLKPVARRLLGFGPLAKATADAVASLERRAMARSGHTAALSEVAALSWMLAATMAAGVIAGALSASAVCGIAVGLGLMVALFQGARTDCERHAEAVREEVPEALRSMGVCFRAGLSLLQTMRQVAHELDGSLGKLFEVAAQRLEMGSTTTEALAVLRTARNVPELSFVAVALDAQHQSGGSMGAVLDAARESVENELALRRSLRVQTAQAKLSARIVTLMPFLLVALFSLMSPGFLDPFFASWAGMGLLVLALAMDGAGIVIVHRMLKSNME